MSDLKQILSAEIISITGGVMAGWLLASYKSLITAVSGIFIFLPGFLAMRGNLSGALSARLSTALHLGTIKPFEKSKLTNSNLIATSIMTLILSLMLSLFAYLISLLLGFNNPEIIYIGLIAGLLSGALMIPLTVLSTFYLFKKGLDPDNIMGPYITTIGDIICMASLIIAIVIV